MTPAQQRLDAHELLGRQPEDGLVLQEQLPRLEGTAQVALKPQAPPRGGLHVGGVGHAAALAGRLGLVQGEVRVAQELVGRLVSGDHADAHADPCRASRQGERALACVEDPARRSRGGLGRRLEGDRELVAPQARDDVL